MEDTNKSTGGLRADPEKRPVQDNLEINNDANDGTAYSIRKDKVSIKDESGDLAVQALSLGDVDPAASKRVLRKIDMYILPFLCLTYALQVSFYPTDELIAMVIQLSTRGTADSDNWFLRLSDRAVPRRYHLLDNG